MKSLYESIIKNTNIGYETLIEQKTKELFEFFRNNLIIISDFLSPKKLKDGFDIGINTTDDTIFINKDNNDTVFPTFIHTITNRRNRDVGIVFKNITITDFSYFPRNCKYLRFRSCDIKSFDDIVDCFSLSKYKHDTWDCGIYFERAFGNDNYKLNNIDFKDVDVNINWGVIDYAKIKNCKFNNLYIRYSVSEDIQLLKNVNINYNPFFTCAQQINSGHGEDMYFEMVANGLPGLCELIKNNDIKELMITGIHEKFLDARLDCMEKILLDKEKQKKLLKFYKK